MDELSLKHYTIVNSEWFIDLNIKHKTHRQEKTWRPRVKKRSKRSLRCEIKTKIQQNKS